MLYRDVEHQLVGVQRISGMAQETVVPDALIWPCPQRLGAPDFQYAHAVFLRTSRGAVFCSSLR